VKPNVIEFWQGFFEVEEPGSDWERHAALMSKLDTMLSVQINTNIGTDDTPYKPSPPVEFLPHGWQDKPEMPATTGETGQAVMKSIATPGASVKYVDDN